MSELDPKVVKQYIESAEPILEKSASDAASYRAKAPVVVGKLIALGVLDSNNKQAAINSLQSPIKLFEVVNHLLDKELAGPVKSAAPAPLGSPEKAASINVNQTTEKDSDKIWSDAFTVKQ